MAKENTGFEEDILCFVATVGSPTGLEGDCKQKDIQLSAICNVKAKIPQSLTHWTFEVNSVRYSQIEHSKVNRLNITHLDLKYSHNRVMKRTMIHLGENV